MLQSVNNDNNILLQRLKEPEDTDSNFNLDTDHA